MKSWKISVGLSLLTAIVIGLAAQAQFTETSQPAPSPDSIVQLAAEDLGLEWVAPETLPRHGTFWVVTSNGLTAPYPCFPGTTVLPVYAIVDGIYLVDQTGGQVNPGVRRFPSQSLDATPVSPLEALAGTVLNLIGEIQAATELRELRQMYTALGMDAPPGFDETGEGGEYTNQFTSTFVIDTNLLWLELTNVSSGTVHAQLHSGTNQFTTNQVFAIWTTTNLLAAWQVEAEVWPTSEQTNLAPFTLPMLNREMLFVRSEDWTGKDSNDDDVPDWWAWQYFGGVNLVLTNLDYSGSGLTFAEDFSNNITPTVFTFSSIQTANNYVQSSSPTVQLDVAGTPYYIATLIDDTNFSNASWNAYSGSTVTVNLGDVQGWHEVWIGLRGHGDDSVAAVWQRKRLKFDSMSPTFFITNPTNTTVDIPMIQLQGFSPEALRNISYDLTNAAGLLTNQQVLVLNQHYDTNTWEFTTNTWQAFDLVLTNGMNTVTLHATDLAGNTATASYSLTLDYSAKTNPPGVQITWPQSGTEISGSCFTMDGQVSDATITLSATITDTNGHTNTVSGLVERSGKFWVDNLPLSSGTNIVSLKLTDAAGNQATTNIMVMQSAVTCAMNPVSDPSQLWQPTVSVTGTISDTTYAIWVNGVKGHNNGDGTWSAENVPTTPGGVASFTMVGYAPNEQQPDGSFGN